jgi:hypothetical protein
MIGRLSLVAVAVAVAPALLSAILAACGGASSSPTNAGAKNAREIGTMDDRLQGSWRFADFRPEVAPDPMFQALLISQLGVAIVRFERGHLYSDSPNFHVARTYRVSEAAGPLFTVESPDVGGAVFTSSGAISDDGQRITFRGNTDPWRGSGTLVRVK